MSDEANCAILLKNVAMDRVEKELRMDAVAADSEGLAQPSV